MTLFFQKWCAVSMVFGGVLLGAAAPANAAAPPGYYDSAAGLSGTPLKDALYNIIKNHTVLPYSSSSQTDTADALKVIDEDPGNSSNVKLHYKGTSVAKSSFGSTWNREHLWPQSKGADVSPKVSDLHHLFAEDASLNSSRGNSVFNSTSFGPLPFSANNSDSMGNQWNGTNFSVHPAQRGDVARAILYMDVRYPEMSLLNSTSPGYNQMGVLDVLLIWHSSDLPDAAEQLRNDRIYDLYQHNRNPFVDNPDYVNLIYGGVTNGNTLTVSINPAIPGGNIGAGSVNAPLLSLEMTANANEWDLDRLIVTKTGTMPDGDVTNVRLYRDSDNSGAVSAGDNLLDSEAFSGGSATLICGSPSRITTTPARFLITATLSGTATNGSTLQATVNTNSIDSNSSGGTDTNPTSNINLNSNTFTVSGGVSNGDTLGVGSTNRATGTIAAGTQDYPLLSLHLQAGSNEWDLATVGVSQIGTIADAQVTALKLFVDADNSGTVNTGDTLLDTRTLSAGAAVFTPASAYRITTTQANLLITGSIIGTALNGSTLSVQVNSITPSNSGGSDVTPGFSPFASSAATVINGVADGNTVTVGTIDRAPATIAAGLTNTPLLTVQLTANSDEWDLGSMTFTRLGTAGDANIVGVSLYDDSNNSGFVEDSDSLLQNKTFSSSAVTFSDPAGLVRVGTTTSNLLVTVDISGNAANGSTVSIRLNANSILYATSGGVDVNPNNVQVNSSTTTIENSGSGSDSVKIVVLSTRSSVSAFHEYTVLANHTALPINMTGWELRTHAGGDVSVRSIPIGGVIPGYGHFLIASSEYGGSAGETIMSSGSAGSLSVDYTVAGTGLSGSGGLGSAGRAFGLYNGSGGTATRIDGISYNGGPTNNFGIVEGNAFSGTADTTTGVYHRKRPGGNNIGFYTDTNDNATDLEVVSSPPKLVSNSGDISVPVTVSAFSIE